MKLPVLSTVGLFFYQMFEAESNFSVVSKYTLVMLVIANMIYALECNVSIFFGGYVFRIVYFVFGHSSKIRSVTEKKASCEAEQ